MLPTFGRYALAIICVAHVSSQEHVRSYKGFQVVRVKLNSPFAFEQVKNVFLSGKYEFWNTPSAGSSADILVPPALAGTLKTSFSLLGIPYEVVFYDLQSSIDYESANYIDRRSTQMSWDKYHTVETIHGYLDQMAQKYPNLVSVFDYGKSTEGRSMKGMKISTQGQRSSRPAIWIDAGIHAREWISPATVTYMANEIILNATKSGPKIVDYFDFYIMPVMNPDGYAHTMKAVGGDRMWRKTRSENRRSRRCRGVDPNRNWDYKWGGKGTSNDPCSETYRGERPASEPEVSSSQNFIYKIKDSIKLFLTFHAYSQLLLLPWSHDNVRCPDHDQLMAVGNKAISALSSVYGTKYKIGNTAEILYPAAGGSFDWAKGVAGVDYAYCYELRDTGRFGFLLPPNQIIPSGKETFEAVKSMVEDMTRIYIKTEQDDSEFDK